jgi:hypothetical protein
MMQKNLVLRLHEEWMSVIVIHMSLVEVFDSLGLAS